MQKALWVINSVIGAALLTAVTAVAVLLFLMFSTGKEAVHKEGLLGSVFFETKVQPDGATGIVMGVANPAGLIIIFLFFAVVLAFAQIIYRQLKQHRAQLIKERSNI